MIKPIAGSQTIDDVLQRSREPHILSFIHKLSISTNLDFLNDFSIVSALCDLVHDVETIYVLCSLSVYLPILRRSISDHCLTADSI